MRKNKIIKEEVTGDVEAVECDLRNIRLKLKEELQERLINGEDEDKYEDGEYKDEDEGYKDSKFK